MCNVLMMTTVVSFEGCVYITLLLSMCFLFVGCGNNYGMMLGV